MCPSPRCRRIGMKMCIGGVLLRYGLAHEPV